MSALPDRDPGSRDETGRFRKGVSGNPHGKPKGAGSLSRRAREVVGEDGHTLVDFHEAIVTLNAAKCRKWKIDPEKVSIRERQESADWLAQRGFGAPIRFSEQEGDDPLGLADAQERLVGKLSPVAQLAERRSES